MPDVKLMLYMRVIDPYIRISWRPAWQTCLQSAPATFFFFVFILALLCTVNVRCKYGRIVYSREALLSIKAAHYENNSELFIQPYLDTYYIRPARTRRRRGKRGGLHARLKARATRPPLPSLLLTNVRSLENKMDELRTRTTTQREIRECCALIFTETWTTDNTPDSAIQLQTHSVHRGDRTSASGKNKGGGVCVYTNDRWCLDTQVMEKHCSVDIEVLMVKCRPFYLQREFSAVFLLAVYISPRANRTAALGLLHDTISKHETAHPDAVFVVAGDFNHCNLRTVLPKYHQYVSFPTRDNNILDHVYSNVKGAYKAAPRPHFGQSDHIFVFLYPSYRQLLKQAPAVSKTVKVWNEETDLVLQDCFNSTDWDVFKTAAVREDYGFRRICLSGY